MYIRKFLYLIIACITFVGCSTGGYQSGDWMPSEGDNAKMGVRYLLGRGAVQNDQKAFYYFNRAAEDGDPLAQNELAYLYAAGKGTKQDYTQALNWYQKAADHGLASAQYNLALMYLYGLGTPKNKTLALNWLQKSAAHGFEPAKQRLARS
ncbi:MAG: sel1 repeat family protein [Gammaproteobacteria bacterium]|nr:sel1 repeat family protein [Gammaproteobacteria bacterium]